MDLHADTSATEGQPTVKVLEPDARTANARLPEQPMEEAAAAPIFWLGIPEEAKYNQHTYTHRATRNAIRKPSLLVSLAPALSPLLSVRAVIPNAAPVGRLY